MPESKNPPVGLSSPTVKYAVSGRVAVITLNRPERMNAFIGEMTTNLKAAMGEAVSDPAVRTIVLTGAGGAFCAGADMAALSSGAPLDGDPEQIRALDARFTTDLGPHLGVHLRNADRFGYFLRSKKPIIAAVNGAAAGLGFALSLYADIRIASANAIFVTSFGQRGLIAEHGVAWLLSRLVGPSRAMDLLFSSRRLVADEAAAMGLVNMVAPPEDLLDVAMGYAQGIAESMSPRSLAVMKAQVWQANFEDFDTVLATAVSEAKLAGLHPDKSEGVAHFREKRLPHFADI